MEDSEKVIEEEPNNLNEIKPKNTKIAMLSRDEGTEDCTIMTFSILESNKNFIESHKSLLESVL